MKKVGIIALVLIITIAMLGFAGGGRDSAARPSTVTIAVSAPFTGTGSILGEWIRSGILMAVDEINASGGILGAQVSTVIYDDEANPSTAANVVRRALFEDNAIAIFGPNMSSAVIGVHQLAAQARKPMLVGATSPSFGFDRVGNEYLFRLRPDDTMRVTQLIKYVVENLGKSRPGIIYGTTDYCTSALEVAEQALASYGIPIIAREQIREGDRDATSQILRMRSAGIDVVIGLTHEPEAALFCIQAKQHDLNVPLTGFSAWTGPGFTTIVGDAGAGVIATTGWVPEVGDTDPVSRDFVRRYESRWNMEASELSQCYYDGVFMLKAAIERAGSFDGPAIARALKEVEHQGIMRLRADEKHNFSNVCYVIEWTGTANRIIAKIE